MNFPLPPVPDPLLPLVNLNFQTARELCKFLDRDDNCKILLDYLLAKLPPGARVVTQSGVTGEIFLNFLKNRLNGTVKDLEYMLEQCSLEEPLYLFREQTPVEIIIQPTSQITLIDGQSNAGIDLEINPNAFPMPRFQWFFQPEGGDAPLIPLDGKISQTLIFPTFSPSDVGLYFCQILQKRRDGTDRILTSRSTLLSMEKFAPNILLQPEDCVFHINDQIELKCCAKAYPSPAYQWSKNNVKLPGEVHSTLLISNASIDHSGYYACLISNALGAVLTREAQILVKKLEPLRIITQPMFPNDAPVREGSIIHLECEAVSGMPSIYYQWVCNQIELQGQTNQILSMLALPQNGATTLQFYCNIWTDLGGDEIKTQVATTKIDTSVLSQQQHTASMKMALLIGNWTYKNMDRLEMVRPDIKSFHDILYNMNFEVMALCNLAKNEIRTAVEQFCHLLLPGAYVVVYFAGHGIYNFGDYIVPVDAPSDLQYTLDDLISVNEIISHVQNKQPKLLTFLLDTCRTIPQRDVTPASYSPLPLNSQTNLILGYATSENRGAYEVKRSQNGMFMMFFKQEIKKPKIFIDVALKNVQKRFTREVHEVLPDQIPQVTSFLGEDLSLHDPIDGRMIGAMSWNKVFETYYRWKSSKPARLLGSILWNGSIIDITVEFLPMDDCFLNALTIEVTFANFGDEQFTLIPIVRPQCLEILQTVQEFPRYTVTIHKLQTLTEDAVVRFRVAEIDRDVFSIDLGRPLISSVPTFYESVNTF